VQGVGEVPVCPSC